MTATTPLYALTYPTTSDALLDAVTTIPHQLALDVESTISSFGGVAAPGAWQTPTLAAGANIGGGFALTRYRKAGSIVQLRGTLTFAGGASAGTTLFTLPVGYRPSGVSPAGSLIFPAAGGPGYCRVDVTSGGAVQLQTAIAAAGFLSLDAISFYVD